MEPALDENSLNLIGYTASFCQVFGSIFAARHLRYISNKKIVSLFGGSSFSLPEGGRTLQKWGLDGIIVVGSGEGPLHNLLEFTLKHEETSASRYMGSVEAENIVNVIRIGQAHKPVELAMSKSYMRSLPDPSFDDYFEQLKLLCSDHKAYQYACENFVSLPLEGSRGCFAKCDFCHNPNITSDFTTLTGVQVAERSLRMAEKYGVKDITFVDSVCNTWAEGYADRLLDKEAYMHAFMELRVHAPEIFWTKLALSGATALQLGIEAISDPLLTSMRKGTSVMQNLAATKYMAEMGTKDASNLIIYHPRSTVDDVEETKRVMKLLEHFPVFHLSRFVVSYASPIYNELSDDKKNELNRGFDWLPRELEAYGWPRHLSYTWPNKWSSKHSIQAWANFQKWYEEHTRNLDKLEITPEFNVEKQNDRLLFFDTRFNETKTYTLNDDYAEIYNLCHAPQRMSRLVRSTNIPKSKIEDILINLTERKSLIKVNDTYLSIAIRPKSELIQNYLAKRESKSVNLPLKTSTDIHTVL